jgi:hypothetical protein
MDQFLALCSYELWSSWSFKSLNPGIPPPLHKEFTHKNWYWVSWIRLDASCKEWTSCEGWDGLQCFLKISNLCKGCSHMHIAIGLSPSINHFLVLHANVWWYMIYLWAHGRL